MASKSVMAFQVIEPREFTEADRAVLRAEARERVRERLEVMIGDGRIHLAVLIRKYKALMEEIGHA